MRVTLVDGDYWQGLYFDGKLEWQHHKLQIHEFVEMLQAKVGSAKFEYEHIGLEDEQLEYLEHVGELPDKLEDLNTKW